MTKTGTSLMAGILSTLLLVSCTPGGAEQESESKKGTVASEGEIVMESVSDPEASEDRTATDETESDPGGEIGLPADAIDAVNAWGISADPGMGKVNSFILAEKLAELPDGATVYFRAGRYELLFPMYITGRRNITLVGDGATLVRTGTDNQSGQSQPLTDPDIPEEFRYLTASSSFIVALGNDGLEVRGFTFEYEIPTSLSGKVLSVSGSSAEIRLTDGASLTGKEYVTVINTFTEDGIPDRTFEQYAATRFSIEKLGEDRLRISGMDPGGASRLRAGTRICLRLCTAKEYIINLQNTANTRLCDLTMKSSFNGGILVGERCAGVTVQSCTVKSENPEALMSLNADVIHVAGETKSVLVENCCFERPGDDFVNVHMNAYVVSSVNGNEITAASPRFGFSPLWAAAGETLRFYDRETFSVLGEATVESVGEGSYRLTALPEGVKSGSVAVNVSTIPDSVVIRNNQFKYNRARGLLLQSENVLVEGNTFYGIALAAILVAPDLENWYEMVPARHLEIRNNDFKSCGKYAPGVIQLSCSHDDAAKRYEGYLHEGVIVTENSFSVLSSPTLYGVCVADLHFAENEIDSAAYGGAWVKLAGCEGVTLDSAVKDRAELADVALAE